MSTAMRQWICRKASPESVGRDRGLEWSWEEGWGVYRYRERRVDGGPGRADRLFVWGSELRWVRQRTRGKVKNWDQRVDGEGGGEEKSNR